MISGYAKHGKVDIAHELFDKMSKRDITFWNTMITAYTSIGRVEDAKLMFDEMLDSDVVSRNLIITSYAKMCVNIKDTHGLFGKMLEPDVVLSVIPLHYVDLWKQAFRIQSIYVMYAFRKHPIFLLPVILNRILTFTLTFTHSLIHPHDN